MTEQCQAEVYRKDTYRVSRRGDGRHFRMHYSRGQCARKAKRGGLCEQHAKMDEKFSVPRFNRQR